MKVGVRGSTTSLFMGERWAQLSPFLHCYCLKSCIKQLTLLSTHVLSVHPLFPPLTGPNGEIKHSTLLLKGLKGLSISDENHCLQTGWGLGWIRRFDLECWSLKFETWPEQTLGCLTLYQTPNSPLSQTERAFKLYFKL